MYGGEGRATHARHRPQGAGLRRQRVSDGGDDGKHEEHGWRGRHTGRRGTIENGRRAARRAPSDTHVRALCADTARSGHTYGPPRSTTIAPAPCPAPAPAALTNALSSPSLSLSARRHARSRHPGPWAGIVPPDRRAPSSPLPTSPRRCNG